MDKVNIKYRGKDVTIHTYTEYEIISYEIKKKKNFYEIEFLEYILNHYPKHKNIIDIGANIGNHSLFFSEYMEYDKIYCFEPFDGNVEILKENLKNKINDKVGEQILYNSQQENNGGFSLECYNYPKSKSYKVLDSVKVNTLDSYNLENITMIKIDVESHELPVLNGSIDTIKRNKPIIFVEDLSYNFGDMFTPNRFNEFFTNINYKLLSGNILDSMMDLWVPIN